MKLGSLKILAAATLFLLLCWAAAGLGPDRDAKGQAVQWYSIVPPLLAVSLALAIGRILLSLIVGVLAGGLLITVPEAPLSLTAWVAGAVQMLRLVVSGIGLQWNEPGVAMDWAPLQILAFVVQVIAMIGVLIAAGGLHAIVLWLSRFAKGARSSQLMTALLGLVVFIDDYANTMIVGSSMRPLTDRYGISREKLAFLVDSTSAPIAGLAIISTWIGYEVGLFNQVAETLGIERDGYTMFFDAVSFRFYCILLIVFVLANAISGKDFGPMRRAQRRAMKTGEWIAPDANPPVSGGFTRAEPDPQAKAGAATALLPLGTLFAVLLGGIWMDGGGIEFLLTTWTAPFRPAVWLEVIAASDSIPILAWAAAAGLAVAVVTASLLARLPAKTIGQGLWAGIRTSWLPVTILTLAWGLKEAADALGTGPFLVAAVGDVLSPAWFPALIFVVASLTAFATGTSFGTMAILIPIAVPLAYSLEGNTYGLVTVITLAAVLDGAIFGDHCSPISDTTIMSSVSSSCDHVHHVRTQLPYALTVAGLALICGYVPAATGVPPWAGLALGAALIVGLFWRLRRA